MIEPDALLRDVVAGWHDLLAGHGRRLEVVRQAAGKTKAAEAAVRQVLGVLLDNAAIHGRGSVTVTSRDSGDAFAVDVADEGQFAADLPDLFPRGHSGTGGSGIGLARDLAEAEGGRLRPGRSSPTTFTLLLPPAR
ncbi:MAG: hypothetical protein QOI78_7608 [Actinomycetota bacterium]|nr:hypothetical protein [Actinomycetota bacterium]